MEFDSLNALPPTTTALTSTTTPHLVLEDDEEALRKEITLPSNQEHTHLPLIYSSPSVDGMTTVTTTTTTILNPLGVLISSSSSDTFNQPSTITGGEHRFVPPPIGVPSNHFVLNNHDGIYVGCDNPYATPRNKTEEKDDQDSDPFGTNNIDIEDDDNESNSPTQKHNATINSTPNSTPHHHSHLDDAPGVHYRSPSTFLDDSNNITSRIVTTPLNNLSRDSNEIFHNVDLGNPTPSPSTSTQVFFTSNPMYPLATTSETMSIQATSPYSKIDPHTANRFRPSLDQPLPDIPTLNSNHSINENSIFQTVHQQPTITIHITEDSGEYVASVEKRFSSAVVVSVALFFIGLPFLSCFPFLLLFPYRHSNVARVRSLGHISVVVFNMLCVVNLCLLLCMSVPIFFVLIVNGIVYSNAAEGNNKH